MSRLNRLLAFIEIDPRNLALRKDAIQEAHAVGSWETARQLIDIGLQMHGNEPELLALSGFANLQALRYPDAEQSLRAALGQGLERGEVRCNLHSHSSCSAATGMQSSSWATQCVSPHLSRCCCEHAACITWDGCRQR